jgi:hypothetical protein
VDAFREPPEPGIAEVRFPCGQVRDPSRTFVIFQFERGALYKSPFNSRGCQ